MHSDPAAAGLLTGPRANGIYARFEEGGAKLTLLDAEGNATRTLGAGSGLVGATRREREAPVWLVTGTDQAGVDLAARAFRASSLDGRFALALSGSQALALPQPGGQG
jgi:hypothetical protein